MAQPVRSRISSRGTAWRLALAMGFASVVAGAAGPQKPVAPHRSPDDSSTQVLTLPTSAPPESGPDAQHLTEPLAGIPDLAAGLDNPEAARHYQTALVALKDHNASVAADEMNQAARLEPANALVWYGLAAVEARNQQLEPALGNVQRALGMGLPPAEARQAGELLASIRYQIERNRADEKAVTPIKLWGMYDAPLEDPSTATEDLPGRTVFKTWTPVLSEVSLWQVDGAAMIRGHWLERTTFTEAATYPHARHRDPQIKTTTYERWWAVTILIDADGSLEGSRMETCYRKAGDSCESHDDQLERVIPFHGSLLPNGDLAIVQDHAAGLTLRKKSRLAARPPAGVHIPLD